MSEQPIAVGVARAAELAGVSQDTIREAVRSTALACRYNGNRILIRREDLEQWIDNLPTYPPEATT